MSIAGLCREAVDRALADAGLRPGRHRRGRGRQGARPVRGRDDARAVPGRRARRGRQADAAGAHRRLGRRGDRDRRGQPDPGRRAPPGAGGGVREAVGVQRHVGAVDHAAVHHAGAGRRGRVLRAAHPLLHPPQPAPRRTSARWSRSRTGGTAACNPYAHLQQPDITVEKVRASPMLWDPVRYDETCPSSDGACAVVLGDQAAARGHGRGSRWPGSGRPRCAPSRPCSPARTTSTRGPAPTPPPRCGARPASPARIDEIDVAEIYVPFSWFEPMWLENLGFAGPGEGWRLTEAGETEIGGAAAGQPVRRGALLQPDRRLRAAAVRRGGACR